MAAVRYARTRRAYRGPRAVICPEAAELGAIEVDAAHAARTAAVGAPDLRLRGCTLWPEHGDCGQKCLEQLKRPPPEPIIWAVLRKWYVGKWCAVCSTPFGEIDWVDRRPALMSRDRKLLAWTQVSPMAIAATLETHLPVCWSCSQVGSPAQPAGA